MQQAKTVTTSALSTTASTAANAPSVGTPSANVPSGSLSNSDMSAAQTQHKSTPISSSTSSNVSPASCTTSYVSTKVSAQVSSTTTQSADAIKRTPPPVLRKPAVVLGEEPATRNSSSSVIEVSDQRRGQVSLRQPTLDSESSEPPLLNTRRSIAIFEQLKAGDDTSIVIASDSARPHRVA